MKKCKEKHEEFQTASEANETISEFLKAVMAVRDAFGISQVSVVMMDRIVGEGPFISSAHMGNAGDEASMAGFHYGQATAKARAAWRESIEAGTKASDGMDLIAIQKEQGT